MVLRAFDFRTAVICRESSRPFIAPTQNNLGNSHFHSNDEDSDMVTLPSGPREAARVLARKLGSDRDLARLRPDLRISHLCAKYEDAGSGNRTRIAGLEGQNLTARPSPQRVGDQPSRYIRFGHLHIRSSSSSSATGLRPELYDLESTFVNDDIAPEGRWLGCRSACLAHWAASDGFAFR